MAQQPQDQQQAGQRPQSQGAEATQYRNTNRTGPEDLEMQDQAGKKASQRDSKVGQATESQSDVDADLDQDDESSFDSGSTTRQ